MSEKWEFYENENLNFESLFYFQNIFLNKVLS